MDRQQLWSWSSIMFPGFSYDGMGHMTNDGSTAYTHDAEGRPTQYRFVVGSSPWDPNWGNPATVNGQALVYDALGRMVENTTAGREYVYAPGGSQVFAVMNGQTTVQAQYPLPAGGIAIYTGATLTYAHPDWLGSGRLVTSSTQTMVADVAYAPFGEQYSASGNFYDFTGQQQWTATGLDDFLFRRYHPVQGRWISPDPAGLAAVDITNPQTWNRYAYVANKPLNAVDPPGLDMCLDGICLSGIGGGGGWGGMFGGLSGSGGGVVTATYTVTEPGWWQAVSGYGSTGEVYIAGDSYSFTMASFLPADFDHGGTLGGGPRVRPDREPAPGQTPVHGPWIYGNWCGAGGSGTPIDPTDAACRAHDLCYAQAGFTPGSNFQGPNAQLQACNQQLCNAVRTRQNLLIQNSRSKGPLTTSVYEVQEPGADGDINFYFTRVIAPWGNSCH